MSEPNNRPLGADLDDRPTPTSEVGDEGGSSGDVEVDVNRVPGTGNEADETWRPAKARRDVIVRDQSGIGRRSP